MVNNKPSKARIFDLIAKKALEENNTSDPEGENKRIREMIKKIAVALKKGNVKAKICLGGSAAKETFLGDNFDIDIFVMFDYKKYKEKDISTILLKSLKHLKPEVIHGSRDYLKIEKRFEIVPVLKIKNPSEVVNVTDASPLHVEWVKKYAKKNPKINSEIKLAKLFFKSCRVYGAESYIKGISGHVADILVINYGSFRKAIEAISKWKETTEIDIEKHKGILDKAKIVGPLTVIDPIQPNRNAAAAVSRESYEILKRTAKKFLANPSIDYFKEKRLDPFAVKDQYNLILKINVQQGKIDLVGAKLLKGFEFIRKSLSDFSVEKSDWWWDKAKECYFYFKLKTIKLPAMYVKEGPSKEYPEHIERFKQKYKNTFIKDNRIYANVKHEFTDPSAFIKNLSQDQYLKSKIKCIDIVDK